MLEPLMASAKPPAPAAWEPLPPRPEQISKKPKERRRGATSDVSFLGDKLLAPTMTAAISREELFFTISVPGDRFHGIAEDLHQLVLAGSTSLEAQHSAARGWVDFSNAHEWMRGLVEKARDARPPGRAVRARADLTGGPAAQGHRSYAHALRPTQDVLRLSVQVQAALEEVRVSGGLTDEKLVYEQAMKEVIRQVGLQCVERGMILDKLLHAYSGILSRYPELLTSAQGEVARLAAGLQTAEDAKAQLARDLRHAHEELEASRNEAARHSLAAQVSRDEARQLQATLGTALGTAAELKAAVAVLVAELAVSDGHVADVGSRLASAQGELAQQVEAHAETRRAFAEEMASHASARQQTAAAHDEADALSAAMVGYYVAGSRASKRVGELERKLAAALESAESARRDHEEARGALERLQTEFGAAQSEGQRLPAVEEKVRELQTSVEEKNGVISRLQKDVLAFRGKWDAMAGDLDAARTRQLAAETRARDAEAAAELARVEAAASSRRGQEGAPPNHDSSTGGSSEGVDVGCQTLAPRALPTPAPSHVPPSRKLGKAAHGLKQRARAVRADLEDLRELVRGLVRAPDAEVAGLSALMARASPSETRQAEGLQRQGDAAEPSLPASGTSALHTAQGAAAEALANVGASDETVASAQRAERQMVAKERTKLNPSPAGQPPRQPEAEGGKLRMDFALLASAAVKSSSPGATDSAGEPQRAPQELGGQEGHRIPRAVADEATNAPGRPEARGEIRSHPRGPAAKGASHEAPVVGALSTGIGGGPQVSGGGAQTAKGSAGLPSRGPGTRAAAAPARGPAPMVSHGPKPAKSQPRPAAASPNLPSREADMGKTMEGLKRAVDGLRTYSSLMSKNAVVPGITPHGGPVQAPQGPGPGDASSARGRWQYRAGQERMAPEPVAVMEPAAGARYQRRAHRKRSHDPQADPTTSPTLMPKPVATPEPHAKPRRAKPVRMPVGSDSISGLGL